jgi:hypothetical protein
VRRPKAERPRFDGRNARNISEKATYYAVSEEPSPLGSISLLALSEVRRYLRRSHAWMMVAFFSVLYALGSMILGGMLVLAHVPGGYTVWVLWGNALGQGPWNYPGLLVVAPWGVLSLPFLATISMVVVSLGVGVGIAVALLIAASLVRAHGRAGAATGAVGSVAGLTPAMIALVTLGACCSTTAAATAGVGLVAQASGSTVNNLLVNNWYLDVFQMSVVFVSLVAQELLLRVYGGLFGLAPDGAPNRTDAPPPPFDRRWLAGGLLRVGLLIGGVTWALAMLAQWATQSPASASAALWFSWIAQHQLLAWFAIATALFPGPVVTFLSVAKARLGPRVLRAALLVSGVSLAVATPPLLATAGAPGFLNEVFGVWGLSPAWGAVSPVYAPGVALFLRWGIQYLLLGGFAIAVALDPERGLAPALWSTGEGSPDRNQLSISELGRPAPGVSAARGP